MQFLPAIIGAVILTTACSGSAIAATFTVDDPTDAVDAKPGDGKCATSAGRCTLRAAVQETNALDGPDSIDIAPGTYKITIPPSGVPGVTTGDLDITDDLTLSGDGTDTTVIDGGRVSRVFYVRTPDRDHVSVAISDLTVMGGKGERGDNGGGVWNGSDLKLSGVTLRQNEVSMDDTQAGGRGGGLFSTGSAVLMDSKFEGNTSEDDGGGIVNEGGTLTMLAVTVSDNRSKTGKGGGIVNRGKGTVALSTIAKNTADEEGGGIENAGALSLEASVVNGNIANTGGGIRNTKSLVLSNVTISANSAATLGGGIANQDAGGSTLNNVTISANVAKGASGGGISTSAGGHVHAANSIIAANQGGGAPDCAGKLDSEGYNLIQDGTGCELAGKTSGNILGQDAKLAPLAANDGPTMTHALQSGSPAIDAGNPAKPGEGESSCKPADQRGIARPADGNGDGKALCDIGAYELK